VGFGSVSVVLTPVTSIGNHFAEVLLEVLWKGAALDAGREGNGEFGLGAVG
jgi:hypothetical protein